MFSFNEQLPFLAARLAKHLLSNGLRSHFRNKKKKKNLKKDRFCTGAISRLMYLPINATPASATLLRRSLEMDLSSADRRGQ
jgi:hypothetical protein